MRKLLALLVVAGSLIVTSPPRHAAADDERIAFRRWLNASHDRGAIFTIDPDGTELRRVTHAPYRGFATQWPDLSPDSRWIAYQRERDGYWADLFKIRTDGTHKTYLSGTCTDLCLQDIEPAWSPSGKRIAFQRAFGASPNADYPSLPTIFVMRADGTHPRQVTQLGSDPTEISMHDDGFPSWSPDGNRLVFTRYDNNKEETAIFTVRPDGSGLRKLTPWKPIETAVDWSPDGRWILFVSRSAKGRTNLSLIHPDGSGVHRITRNGGSYEWLNASFSPNGRQIVAARLPGYGDAGEADIYVVTLEGELVRNVTRSAPWESMPAW